MNTNRMWGWIYFLFGVLTLYATLYVPTADPNAGKIVGSIAIIFLMLLAIWNFKKCGYNLGNDIGEEDNYGRPKSWADLGRMVEANRGRMFFEILGVSSLSKISGTSIVYMYVLEHGKNTSMYAYLIPDLATEELSGPGLYCLTSNKFLPAEIDEIGHPFVPTLNKG